MRDLPPHDPDDLGCPHCGERCDVCVDTLVETTELRAEVGRLVLAGSLVTAERDDALAEVERLRETLTEIRGLSMPNLLAEIGMYGKSIGDWDVVDRVAREALDRTTLISQAETPYLACGRCRAGGHGVVEHPCSRHGLATYAYAPGPNTDPWFDQTPASTATRIADEAQNGGFDV